MAEYLKKGADHTSEAPQEVRWRVAEMLEDIASRGEEAVREHSEKLDGWNPESFRLSEERIEEACATIGSELREHLDLAHSQIRSFAEAQLDSMKPLDVEIGEGVTLGHRHVPIGSVGAYVPGGQYKLVSSALMSVLTAKVAGVERVVAMSAPSGEFGIHAPTIYAMCLAGADDIYALGGVQAMAAMTHGALEGLEPVDMLVGAGNVYVAEAKRQLFGRVGIDLIAGPTEILVIADETARPHIVAVDLLGQAEHGPTSPAVLVTTSRKLGGQVVDEIEKLLTDWPTAEVTEKAWEDFGTVVVAESVNEAISLSDDFAPEHLELQVDDEAPYETGLKNYGSLFVGEGTTVPFGDKVVGTNHTLPTARAARYTGGLWVGKFLKTLTYQRLTEEASRRMAVAAAGICRAENLPGHEISAAIRLEMDEYPRSSGT
ncbi:histidinol dehydrogenase [soil metagenome]